MLSRPSVPSDLSVTPDPSTASDPNAVSDLVEPVLAWYDACGRDLPWRRPEATPWGVFVSEVMSQQTPLSRVEPRWVEWLTRWPTPAARGRLPR